MSVFVAARNLGAWAIRRATVKVTESRREFYYRVRETRSGHALLRAAAFTRSPFVSRMRRRAAHNYVARAQPPAIDPVKGYSRTSVEAFENFDAVLDASRTVFRRKVGAIEKELAGFDDWQERKQQKYLQRKDRFLRNLLNDQDLRRNPVLVDFALSDAMFGMATRYLGTVPYLCRVDLVYSVPRLTGQDENIASQLFHVDPEGLTQVKFFIHVYDVGEAEGPFTFIPADETTRILAAIRGLRRRQGRPHVGRYLDEEIAAVGGAESIVRLKGPTGSGVAIDTSRCLHMGSRVKPGAWRLCLYLQYCTTLEPTNVFDIRRFKRDPVRYLAVKHSVSPSANRIDSSQAMA
jgi:hypothetical protein